MSGALSFGPFLDTILEGVKNDQDNPCADFCLDSSAHAENCGSTSRVNEDAISGLRSLGAALYRVPPNTANYYLRNNARAWVIRAAGVGYAQEFVDSRFVDLRTRTRWRRQSEPAGASTELPDNSDRGLPSQKPDEAERRILEELCTAIDYHVNKLDLARSLSKLPPTYDDAPWYVHLHAAAYSRLPTANATITRVVAYMAHGLDIALCSCAESDEGHSWTMTIYYHLLSERPCYGALCHEGWRWTEIVVAMLLMFPWCLVVHLCIDAHIGIADRRLAKTSTAISSSVLSLQQVERLPPAWRCLLAIIKAVLKRGDDLTDSESAQVRSFLDLFEDNFVATSPGDILDAVHEYDIGAIPKEKVGAAISDRYTILEVDHAESHTNDTSYEVQKHCRCRRCNLIRDVLRKLGFLGKDLLFERRVFNMYAHTALREYNAVDMFVNNTTRMRHPLIHVWESVWLSRLLNPVIDNACARLAWVSAMGDAEMDINYHLQFLQRPGHRDRTLLLLGFCQTIDRHLDKLGSEWTLPVNMQAAPWSVIGWLLFPNQLRIFLLPILWKVHWWIYGETIGWRWIIDLPLRVLWTAIFGPILLVCVLQPAGTLMYHLAGHPHDAIYELAEAYGQLDYHGRQLCVAWALLREAATQLIESNFMASAEAEWQAVCNDVHHYASFLRTIDTGDIRVIFRAYSQAIEMAPHEERIRKEYTLRYSSRTQARGSAAGSTGARVAEVADEDDDF